MRVSSVHVSKPYKSKETRKKNKSTAEHKTKRQSQTV